MTVSTEIDSEEYTGNGITTTFPYRFRILQSSNMVVTRIDLTDVETTLALGTDYTITGAGGYAGGNIILSSPLPNGYGLTLVRDLPITQETDLRNQGTFFAEVHEDAFDKLTMLIQQVFSRFNLALRRNSPLSKYYDAKGYRIANLADPINEQDAATKDYTDSVAASNLSHTLRTPEPIPYLPSAEQRKNKIVAMDNNGNPIMVLPESGTAADVLIELAKPTGAGSIGASNGNNVQQEIDKIKLKFSSFSSLRSSLSSAIGDYALLTGWHSAYTGYGSGIFKCVDKTGLVDDGGDIAISSGYAWIRITGNSDATKYGVVPNASSGFDNKQYIISAAASGSLVFPAGTIHTSWFNLTSTKYVGGSGYTKLVEIAGTASTTFITHSSTDGTWASRIDGIVWENLDIYPLDTHIGLYSYFTAGVKMKGIKIFGGSECMRIQGIATWFVDSCEFRESKGGTRNVYITPKMDGSSPIGTWIIFHKCFFASSSKDNVEVVSIPSVWFRDCIVSSATGTGILVSKDATTYPGVELTLIKITGCDIDANRSRGITLVDVKFPEVSNNWISSGRDLNQPGAVLLRCSNITVNDNEVLGCGNHGISIEICDYGSVSNNLCNDNRATGIRVQSDSGISSKISISGNTCCRTSMQFLPTPQLEGIHIEGDRITSYGNVCLGNSTSQYQNNSSNKQEGMNIIS